MLGRIVAEFPLPRSNATLGGSKTSLTRFPAPVHTAFSRDSLLRWNKRVYVQRYARKIARITQMNPRELQLRIVNKLYQQIGLAPQRPAEKTKRGLLKRLTELATQNEQTRSECLAIGFDKNFFFGPAQRDSVVSIIRQEFPNARDHIISLANRFQDEGLCYLGKQIKIKVGEFDWQADPLTAQRAWTTNPLDEATAISVSSADVKYVWEVNRFQFLPLLGRAYWLTGNSSHGKQAIALIDDWIATNPVGCGVNWCSHLEVAMRVISWLWAMPFVLSLPGLDASFLDRWLDSIEDHYHHLRHNLSIYTDPTNHLIGEATALWMLSVTLPMLPGANDEQKRAIGILTKEVEQQIWPDGVNREQATSYHRFVLDFYFQIIILAERSGIALPSIVQKQTESMVEFVVAMAGPSGECPMIGDSDDARGVPFLDLVGWDFRDTISTGAALFRRGDWMQTLANTPHEVTTWLLGTDSVTPYKSLQEPRSLTAVSKFSSGG